jgi:hypothetical protein
MFVGYKKAVLTMVVLRDRGKPFEKPRVVVDAGNNPNFIVVKKLRWYHFYSLKWFCGFVHTVWCYPNGTGEDQVKIEQID